MGYWGRTQHAGLTRIVWTVGLPLVAAATWAFYAAGRGGWAWVLAVLVVVHYVVSYDRVVRILRR